MFQTILREWIREAQKNDLFLCKIMVEVGKDKQRGFVITDDKVVIYEGRLCVPKDEKLMKEILKRARSSLHPLCST